MSLNTPLSIQAQLRHATRLMETIKVGDGFRDFSLKEQNGRDFKLSEQADKRVLLSFHPLAWTSVCAKQIKVPGSEKKDI